MHYPANYGYVPHTISEDDDPVDVLVPTPFPLLPGVVVRGRALGLLRMEDEAGGDAKVLAVPTDDICGAPGDHGRRRASRRGKSATNLALRSSGLPPGEVGRSHAQPLLDELT
jgi:hypothetical protein